MYEILKDITPDIKLAMNENNLYIFKRIMPDDADLYKRLSKIKNINIAAVTDIITLEGMTFAVREYVQGISLDEYIEKNKPLSEEEIKRIILSICNGLSSVHQLGIVHRDITPSNIIISVDNTVKIIDFGISRTIKDNKSRDTQILGTAGYAAPEQFGFSQTGIRADIFSVGVLMNYMLTGCMPNEKHASGIFGKIVKKATEIDENNRYKTVEELAEAIKAINPFSIKIRSIVPGFRSDKTSHKVIAITFYILFIAAIISFFKQGNAVKKAFTDTVSWILMTAVPLAIGVDFLNWTEKIKPISKLNKKQKRIVKGVLIAISFMLSSAFIT